MGGRPGAPTEGEGPEGGVYRSKNNLALKFIDKVQHWNLPQAPVVADSALGAREALRQHELSYVVGVTVTAKVRTRDPNAVSSDGLPEPGTLLEVARELPGAAWKTVTWR